MSPTKINDAAPNDKKPSIAANEGKLSQSQQQQQPSAPAIEATAKKRQSEDSAKRARERFSLEKMGNPRAGQTTRQRALLVYVCSILGGRKSPRVLSRKWKRHEADGFLAYCLCLCVHIVLPEIKIEPHLPPNS